MKDDSRRMMTDDGNKFIDKGNVEIIGPEGAWIIIQKADLTDVAAFLSPALTAERDSLRAERDREIDRFQNVLVNIFHTLTGKDCDPRVSIGMTTSAAASVAVALSAERARIREVERQHAATFSVFKRWYDMDQGGCFTDAEMEQRERDWDQLEKEIEAVIASPSNAGAALLARLQAAEAVCEAIDGRHPIAAGDRVGVLLKAWRESK